MEFLTDDNGEIVGIDAMAVGWVPESLHDVEWLMAHLHENKSTAAMLRGRIQEITANLESMARDYERANENLEYLYGKALEKFAQENMPKGSKTFKTPYGKLVYRKTVGTIVQADEEMCLAWCKEHEPDAVKVKESVLVSALKGKEGDLPECFEVSWPQDKFKVVLE